jgi:hypothetical protein
MRYEVTGRGGPYPNGCSFLASTATLALERYLSVQAACGAARAYDADGRGVSLDDLTRLAEAEAKADRR